MLGATPAEWGGSSGPNIVEGGNLGEHAGGRAPWVWRVECQAIEANETKMKTKTKSEWAGDQWKS
jgi:hypothetical protein